MASLTEQLDNFFVTTLRGSRNVVANNIFSHTPLLYWYQQKGRIRPRPGGRTIDEALEYANSGTATWLVKGQTLSLDDAEILTDAVYSWSMVAGNITRYIQDELANRDRYKLIDLVERKINNVKMDLEDELETQLAAGVGTSGKIDGLQHLISDTAAYTTSVGGITPSASSYWQNQTTTMSGISFAAQGLGKMRTLLNNCSKSKGANSRPDVIISAQTPFEYYEDTLQPQQIFSDTKILDAGFENLKFKGLPMMWSSALSGRMYFINTNHIWLYYDPAAYFEMTAWKTIVDQVETRVAQLYVYLSHVTNRRTALGVLHTITTA